MAISILNITHLDINTASNNITVSIPATTVGSTLIVLLSVRGTNTGVPIISQIEDDRGVFDPNPPFTNFYTQIAGASIKSVPSFAQWNEIYYTLSVPAGLTFVKPYTSISNVSIFATVIEASGINITSPVETSSTKNTVATTSTVVGNGVSTAFTNALFVMTGTTSATNPWHSILNSWAQTSTEASSSHKQGYIIASGAQQASVSSNNVFQNYIISEAIFNPTANLLTINLNETINTADTLGDDTSYERSLADAFSLSDFVDFILSSDSYFRSLFETLAVADTFSAIWSAFITLAESVTLSDNISFIKDTKRTLTERLNLQDWFSIKKSSDNWGS